MRYHKIQLICPGRTYGQRTNLMDLCLEGAYIREEKHFNYNLRNFCLFSRFSNKQ